MSEKIELQLTQIKPLPAASNDTADGFYGDGFAPLPEGSLLGLGVRAAHPFFSSFVLVFVVFERVARGREGLPIGA